MISDSIIYLYDWSRVMKLLSIHIAFISENRSFYLFRIAKIEAYHRCAIRYMHILD